MVFWDGFVSDDVAGIAGPIVVYWVYAGMYHTLDSLKLKNLESHRLHSRRDENQKNLVTVNQVIRGVLFQQVLQAAAASFLLLLDPASQGNKPLPSMLTCVYQFLMGMFIMDTYQYFMHRLMHQNKFLYRTLHSWHHRLLVPYACGALYNHPVEGLIMDTIGGGLSFILSGMHPKVAVFFWCFATMKTVDDHCGLALASNPFQLFFANNASYHDIHHQMSGLKYNFSQPFFPIWDHLCGTHMPYKLQPRVGGGVEAKAIPRS